jgi:hypothetical protein
MTRKPETPPESFRCPIVGMKYYPGALAIVTNLPVGTPLFALAEPTNPHDPNAIQVWIETRHIPQVTLDRVPNSGRLASASAWQLGHIAREFAAKLKMIGFPEDCEIAGTLQIGNDGGSRITLTKTWS